MQPSTEPMSRRHVTSRDNQAAIMMEVEYVGLYSTLPTSEETGETVYGSMITFPGLGSV